MIKLQDLTPEVYYRQSRDFQYIGRLYDLVLNSVKTNTDMIYDIPNSDAAGSKMIDLLTLTLGFKPKHNYSVKQLAAICSIFQTILRNKGSVYAIELACTALLHAEGITDECKVYFDEKTYTATIMISQELSDISLLNDLLDYILPAGISCIIVRSTNIDIDNVTNVFVPNTRIIKEVLHSTELDDKASQFIKDPENMQIDSDENHLNGYVGEDHEYKPGFTINSMIYGGKLDDEGDNNNGN